MTTKININDLPALDAYFAKYVADIVVEEHDWPAYTKSMDAVLPYLEKWGTWTSSFKLDYAGHWVDLWVNTPGVGPEYSCPEPPSCEPRYCATAPTLPHAAAVALLRAKGVTVTEDNT